MMIKVIQKTDFIKDKTHIAKYYRQTFEKKRPRAVGLEWERVGVKWPEKSPVPYLNDYKKIVDGLHQQFGWEAEDTEEGNIFTLKRGRTRITTEADGKPEISGAPFQSLHTVKQEMIDICEEIETFSKPLNIKWFTNGISPFHDHDQIKLAPKKRYLLWQKMFDTHRDWMHRYMKSLCGAHFNVDIFNEQELIKTTQILFRLSPVLCGAFANSPLLKGEKTPYFSNRRRLLFSKNSFGREKMPMGMLDSNFSLEKWIDFYLEQEMYLVIRGENPIEVERGTVFNDFMKHGYADEKCLISDFDTHLKTCWTDIRFRIGYLEYRPIDSVPLDELMAFSAFVKGIVFSKGTLEKVKALTKNWAESEFDAIHKIAWTDGIRGHYKAVSFLEILEELLPTADETLRNLQHCCPKNKDESMLLDPLKKMVREKKCVGEYFLDTFV